MWDNLTCWQAARIGDVVKVNCPELFSQFMSEEDYGQSQRTCLAALVCYISVKQNYCNEFQLLPG